MRAARFLLALAWLGCADPGPGPLDVVATSGFTETADFGVLEIWEGACNAAGELRERIWFPGAPDPERMREPLTLPAGGTFCVRIYALLDREQTPGVPCSVLGDGELEIMSGEVDESPRGVEVSGIPTEPVDPVTGDSPRDEYNRAHGGVLCPPQPLAPFQGARLGRADAPTFEVRANLELPTTCLRLTPSEGAPSEQALDWSEPADGVVRAAWPEDLSADVGAYTWQVRACPAGCPAETGLVGEGARCTPYSSPMSFVTRPWADLDADGLEDFAIALPDSTGQRAAGALDGPVHVFLSGAPPGDADSYEICAGAYYSVVVIDEPRDELTCGGPEAPLENFPSYWGIHMAMIDVSGDETPELLVARPNCEMGDAQGGALYAYSLLDGTPDLVGRVLFQGTDGIELYTVGVEALHRDGPRASALSIVGLSVSGSVVATLPTPSSFASTVMVEDKRTTAGFISGHGDIDGNGFADLPYHGLLRLGRRETSYVTQMLNDVGPFPTSSMFAGDHDGDGRPELLVSEDFLNGASCSNTLRVVSPSTDERGVVELETIRVVPRDLPLLRRYDCTGTNPPEACAMPDCEGMGECRRCELPPLVDDSLATAMPLGAAWGASLAPGPRIAYLTDAGVMVEDTVGNAEPVRASSGTSECFGAHMRGHLDLDGDGLNELLALDPASGRLYVACGDGDGTLSAVTSVGLRTYTAPAYGPSDCVSSWSLAP